MVETYFRDGWRVQKTRSGKDTIYEYQRQFTLSGAAEDLDLVINYPFQLNRIDYFSNDATAKSFAERIFVGQSESYAEIVNVAADTNISIVYSGDISDKWTQQPLRIRTAVSASTGGKLLTKTINVTRLTQCPVSGE